MFKRINRILIEQPRWCKRSILWCADAVALTLMFMLAHTLRLSRISGVPDDAYFLAVVPLCTIVFLQAAGFYRVVIRFIDFGVLKTIVMALMASVLALYALAFLLPAEHTPRSIFLIYGALAGAWLLFSRLLARKIIRWTAAVGSTSTPVVIFGAGSAGMQIAQSLRIDGQFLPLAFIDDAFTLRGQVAAGLPVFDRQGFVAWRAGHPGLDTVILAIPSATAEQRRKALNFLQPLGLKLKTLPNLAELVAGRARLSDVRDVHVEDLLSRESVAARPELMAAVISGRNVMVTGAGGSIGSELCRQILSYRPSSLILFEVSEPALYHIDAELQQLAAEFGVRLVPVLGSVLARPMVAHLMRSEGVQVVFHAAAYKHVPLVEANIAVGVRNNVIGTRVVAELAAAAGVERVILVSTDKAVRPTNIMGASKRLAEMVLQGLAGQFPNTTFAMVRFGNVLESSGSVVPRFREQIMTGGPVTVTHPDITRYFMTIPEAAALVVQAGAMAAGGEVFLLDMGDPVKIDDLARTMIHLMGRSVCDETGSGDITIRYVGLRPGEKLYEELLIDADADATAHPKIFKAHEAMLPWSELDSILVRLDQHCLAMNIDEVVAVLQQCVVGYQPDSRRIDPFWCDSASHAHTRA